jgi:hypothetical protein
MWENAYRDSRGDHARCSDHAHQGHEWGDRDNFAAQRSLREYFVESFKMIQKIDPLRKSPQWNESFHAVKAKCVNKRLDFPTSTDKLSLWRTMLDRRYSN